MVGRVAAVEDAEQEAFTEDAEEGERSEACTDRMADTGLLTGWTIGSNPSAPRVIDLTRVPT